MCHQLPAHWTAQTLELCGIHSRPLHPLSAHLKPPPRLLRHRRGSLRNRARNGRCSCAPMSPWRLPSAWGGLPISASLALAPPLPPPPSIASTSAAHRFLSFRLQPMMAQLSPSTIPQSPSVLFFSRVRAGSTNLQRGPERPPGQGSLVRWPAMNLTRGDSADRDPSTLIAVRDPGPLLSNPSACRKCHSLVPSVPRPA